MSALNKKTGKRQAVTYLDEVTSAELELVAHSRRLSSSALLRVLVHEEAMRLGLEVKGVEVKPSER